MSVFRFKLGDEKEYEVTGSRAVYGSHALLSRLFVEVREVEKDAPFPRLQNGDVIHWDAPYQKSVVTDDSRCEYLDEHGPGLYENDTYNKRKVTRRGVTIWERKNENGD